MADKNGLELIGVLFFAATLFGVTAGGLAVRHQLASETPKTSVEVAQLPGHLQPIDAAMVPMPAARVLK
jgi:hypothetical protein